jgi:geranylgeranyl diphosphate synthase type II
MHNVRLIQNLFSAYLQSQSFNALPLELYEPIEYTLALGGKRMRPLLLLMARNLYGDDVNDALDAAVAIEIFHNFTLLHDDIMDEAPIRRNQPTVYKKWNANIAILSGDAMLVKAYDYLCKTPQKNLYEVLVAFNQAAIQVCEGQQWDMNFERRDDVSIDEYLKMIELKTAVLLAASLKIGAIIGGASKEDSAKLHEFGRNIGIAFQLQDDLLDVFSNENEFGKLKGGDIIANKKTYLLLKAFELANPAMKCKLYSVMYENNTDPKEKLNTVIDCYNQLEVEAKTQNQILYFHNKAMEALSSLNLVDTKVILLKELAEDLLIRKS